MMARRIILGCAVAAAAAVPTAEAGKADPFQRGVLSGTVLPNFELTPAGSHAQVHGVVQIAVGPGGVRADGVFANIETGYRVALSRRPCAQLLRAKDPSSLIATTYGRGTFRADGRIRWSGARPNAFAAGLGPIRAIAVELVLEDPYVRATRAEGAGARSRIVACGRAAGAPIRSGAGPVGSLAALDAVGASGIRVYLSAQETRGRLIVAATIECDLPAGCARLMEEEGIFYYFDGAPCGQPPSALRENSIEDLLVVRGPRVLSFHDILVTSVKKPSAGISQRARSVRLRVGDQQIACGRKEPSRWASSPSS